MVVLLQPAEEYNILKGSIIMSLLETWRNLAYEQEMDDLNFIFDEAVEAQKDLVIMVY